MARVQQVFSNGASVPAVLDSHLTNFSDVSYVCLSAILLYAVAAYAARTSSSSSLADMSVAEDSLYRKLYSENSVESVAALAQDTNQMYLLAGCGPSEVQEQTCFSVLDPSAAAALHPYTKFIDLIFLSSDYAFGSAEWLVLVASLGERSGLISPLSLVLQLGVLFILILAFASIYFSMFSNNREEWQADVDFTVSSLSSEAEKELFSIDDATSLCLTLFFFFGVYFGFFLVNCLLPYSEGMSFLLPMPFVLVSLILVPVNLVFDFGLLFVAYLRGASNTSSIFFELVYDYIGVAAFFTRLVVQFVRIVLMIVVYMMMCETVLLNYAPSRSFVAGDSFMDELSCLCPTIDSVSYFLVVVLPARLGYWLYEVLHTFFVVTVQFMAFFTIVFWLFLLFYTFFIYESFECYFKDIRRIRHELSQFLKTRDKK